MRFHTVIFDFDGTLADSLGLAHSVYNECAPELGLPPISPSDAQRCRTKSADELLREFDIPTWKLPRLLHAVRAGMARRIGEVRLFPGATEALGELNAAGVRCGILTSNSSDNVHAVFAAAGLADLELRSCGVSLYGKGTRLRRLLRSAGLAPGEACFVGDEARDIDAARQAGTHAVAVGWGYGDPSSLATVRPDHVATSAADLMSWIRAVR